MKKDFLSAIWRVGFNDRAAVLGVILHTKKDPFVRKLLSDRALVEALDEESGKRWEICFHCDPEGEWDRVKPDSAPRSEPKRIRAKKRLMVSEAGDILAEIELREARGRKRQRRMSLLLPEASFMMTPIGQPTKHEWDALLRIFALSPDQDLPCLLCLFPQGDEQVFSCSMPIRGVSVDEAFNSLMSHVRTVNAVISEFRPENLKNAESLHREVTFLVRSKKHLALMRKLIPWATTLKEFAGAWKK